MGQCFSSAMGQCFPFAIDQSASHRSSLRKTAAAVGEDIEIVGNQKIMPKFLRTRDQPRMFTELDLSEEPPLRLHQGTISFDANDGKGMRVQYDRRTPSEEREHLDKIEAEALRKALKEHNLDPSTTDYPRHSTELETVKLLEDIRMDKVKLWDGVARKVNAAVSKGFPGKSDIHIASMPGADTDVYNNVVFACLEEGISFGIVYEANWAQLWFYVWKSRQIQAQKDGKKLVVLTKPDGSVGFNQSIEITWLKAENISFSVMRAFALLRQTRPLIQADYEEKMEEVRRALAPSVASEALHQKDYSGQEIVHLTAQLDSDVATLEWALKNGADVNAQDFLGITALCLAAQVDCHAAVKVLLYAKADMNKAKNSGASPVFKAAENNSKDCLDLLLNAKADMNRVNNDGVSPVFIAAQENNKECLELLLHAKADMNKAADDGENPVVAAARQNNKECLELLLAAKADFTQAWKGKSALQWAKQKGNTACIKLLEGAEAKTGQKNRVLS